MVRFTTGEKLEDEWFAFMRRVMVCFHAWIILRFIKGGGGRSLKLVCFLSWTRCG